MGKTCRTLYGDGEHCIPGCSPRASSCNPKLVDSAFGCSFRPEHLKEAMLAQQARASFLNRNNEMVLDVRSVERSLPHSIIAFFYVSTMSTSEQADVRELHSAFLAEYRLRRNAAGTPPLLRLTFETEGKDKGGRIVSDTPFHVS